MEKKKKLLGFLAFIGDLFVSVVIAECGVFMYFTRSEVPDQVAICFMLVGVYYAAATIVKREKNLESLTVYVDMDGCLAKWDENASFADTYRGGFFLSRLPEERLIEAVIILFERGVDVRICSKVYNRRAAIEKTIWLRNHGLGLIPTIFVPYDENKSDYIKKTGINLLVDDYSENLREWQKAGNAAIKFRNPINGTKGTWQGECVWYYQSPQKIADTIMDAGMFGGMFGA